VTFCGDCCAQLADASCPGGGEQLCTAYARATNKYLKIIQVNESLTINNIWNVSQGASNLMSNGKIVK